MHKPCWRTTLGTHPMRHPNPSGVCLVKVAALLCDASPQLHSPNARHALREPHRTVDSGQRQGIRSSPRASAARCLARLVSLAGGVAVLYVHSVTHTPAGKTG